MNTQRRQRYSANTRYNPNEAVINASNNSEWSINWALCDNPDSKKGQHVLYFEINTDDYLKKDATTLADTNNAGASVLKLGQLFWEMCRRLIEEGEKVVAIKKKYNTEDATAFVKNPVTVWIEAVLKDPSKWEKPRNEEYCGMGFWCVVESYTLPEAVQKKIDEIQELQASEDPTNLDMREKEESSDEEDSELDTEIKETTIDKKTGKTTVVIKKRAKKPKKAPEQKPLTVRKYQDERKKYPNTDPDSIMQEMFIDNKLLQNKSNSHGKGSEIARKVLEELPPHDQWRHISSWTQVLGLADTYVRQSIFSPNASGDESVVRPTKLFDPRLSLATRADYAIANQRYSYLVSGGLLIDHGDSFTVYFPLKAYVQQLRSDEVNTRLMNRNLLWASRQSADQLKFGLPILYQMLSKRTGLFAHMPRVFQQSLSGPEKQSIQSKSQLDLDMDSNSMQSIENEVENLKLKSNSDTFAESINALKLGKLLNIKKSMDIDVKRMTASGSIRSPLEPSYVDLVSCHSILRAKNKMIREAMSVLGNDLSVMEAKMNTTTTVVTSDISQSSIGLLSPQNDRVAEILPDKITSAQAIMWTLQRQVDEALLAEYNRNCHNSACNMGNNSRMVLKSGLENQNLYEWARSICITKKNVKLSVGQDFEVEWAQDLKRIHNIVAVDLVSLMLIASRTAYTTNSGSSGELCFNVLVTSESPATSKSFSVRQVAIFSLPNTVTRESSRSRLVDTAGGRDANNRILVYEELSQNLVCINTNDKEASDAFKNSIESGRVNHNKLMLDTTNGVAEKNNGDIHNRTAVFAAANWIPAKVMDDAWRSRFHMESRELTEPEKQFLREAEAKVALEKKDQSLTQRREESIRLNQLIQLIVFDWERMIESFLMPITTVASDIFLLLLMRDLKRGGHCRAEARDIKRCGMLARQIAMERIVVEHFFAQGAPHQGQTVETRHFLELRDKSVVTVQDTVSAVFRMSSAFVYEHDEAVSACLKAFYNGQSNRQYRTKRVQAQQAISHLSLSTNTPDNFSKTIFIKQEDPTYWVFSDDKVKTLEDVASAIFNYCDRLFKLTLEAKADFYSVKDGKNRKNNIKWQKPQYGNYLELPKMPTKGTILDFLVRASKDWFESFEYIKEDNNIVVQSKGETSFKPVPRKMQKKLYQDKRTFYMHLELVDSGPSDLYLANFQNRLNAIEAERKRTSQARKNNRLSARSDIDESSSDNSFDEIYDMPKDLANKRFWDMSERGEFRADIYQSIARRGASMGSVQLEAEELAKVTPASKTRTVGLAALEESVKEIVTAAGQRTNVSYLLGFEGSARKILTITPVDMKKIPLIIQNKTQMGEGEEGSEFAVDFNLSDNFVVLKDITEFAFDRHNKDSYKYKGPIDSSFRDIDILSHLQGTGQPKKIGSNKINHVAAAVASFKKIQNPIVPESRRLNANTSTLTSISLTKYSNDDPEGALLKASSLVEENTNSDYSSQQVRLTTASVTSSSSLPLISSSDSNSRSLENSVFSRDSQELQLFKQQGEQETKEDSEENDFDFIHPRYNSECKPNHPYFLGQSLNKVFNPYSLPHIKDIETRMKNLLALYDVEGSKIPTPERIKEWTLDPKESKFFDYAFHPEHYILEEEKRCSKTGVVLKPTVYHWHHPIIQRAIGKGGILNYKWRCDDPLIFNHFVDTKYYSNLVVQQREVLSEKDTLVDANVQAILNERKLENVRNMPGKYASLEEQSTKRQKNGDDDCSLSGFWEMDESSKQNPPTRTKDKSHIETVIIHRSAAPVNFITTPGKRPFSALQEGSLKQVRTDFRNLMERTTINSGGSNSSSRQNITDSDSRMSSASEELTPTPKRARRQEIYNSQSRSLTSVSENSFEDMEAIDF